MYENDWNIKFMKHFKLNEYVKKSSEYQDHE